MTSKDADYPHIRRNNRAQNQENTERPLKRGLPVFCIAYLCYSSMKSCNQFLRLENTPALRHATPLLAMPMSKNNVLNSVVSTGLPYNLKYPFSSIVRRPELSLQLLSESSLLVVFLPLHDTSVPPLPSGNLNSNTQVVSPLQPRFVDVSNFVE